MRSAMLFVTELAMTLIVIVFAFFLLLLAIAYISEKLGLAVPEAAASWLWRIVAVFCFLAFIAYVLAHLPLMLAGYGLAAAVAVILFIARLVSGG